MKIGILALQGAFAEHITILTKLGVDTAEIRVPAQLDNIDGLIIPGGESTTIGKLAVMYDLIEPIRNFAKHKPVWGTCAGMIFMAKEVQDAGSDQPLLGIMDIVVARNAFGRQINSFEVNIDIPNVDDNDPFPAVFIRAPKLISVHGKAKIIASLPDGTPIAAQEDKMVVTSFHPELTNDVRLHKQFISTLR